MSGVRIAPGVIPHNLKEGGAVSIELIGMAIIILIIWLVYILAKTMTEIETNKEE